jgi:Immune inhibitor A peptidase M6
MVKPIRRLSLALALLLLALVAAAPAGAAPVLQQDFEGGLGGWTATGFWHAQSRPQDIAVKAPEINPGMVTIPSGNLPPAFSGNQAAWYGEASTGTFCGSGWSISQAPKSGCTSTGANSGTLTSPTFNLNGALSAILRFRGWWEIEGVNADDYDVMQVEYSTDGGTSWTATGRLNPADNPAGRHDQSYSNNGLATEPGWKEYLVDLSTAIGSSNVKIRFAFDTEDSLYNGFRGWLVDDVVVSTPFDASAPIVRDVTTCSGLQPAPIWIAHGSSFVQGSRVFLDGVQDLQASIPAPDRIELRPTLAGAHTLKVVSPNGTEGNTLPFSAGNCAQQAPGPSGAEKRPSSMQVFCNYIVASETDTCTATVADATGGGRIPTGTVKFTSANGGAFMFGDTCTLRKAELSTVSSCTIEGFKPPQRRPLAVTGSYSGDGGLLPSGGATQFLMAAPGTGAYLQTIQPFRAFGAPNGPQNSQITVTVDNPIRGTRIESEASLSSNGSVCRAGFGGAQASSALAVASKARGRARGRGRGRGRARNRRTVPGLRYKAPRVKRIDAIVVSKTKRGAKAGKVELKLKFNRRKLARKFGRRKQLKLVVRVTLDFQKGQPAVIWQALTLKRVNGSYKVVRGKDDAKATAVAARLTQRSRGPAVAHAAQAGATHRWVGGDDCNTLSVAAQFDQGDNQAPLVGFFWQGQMLCFGGDAAPLNYGPPNGVRGTITSAASVTFSMAEFTNPGYTLSGTLFSGSASVTGRIGGQFPDGRSCQATAPPVLTQVS